MTRWGGGELPFPCGIYSPHLAELPPALDAKWGWGGGGDGRRFHPTSSSLVRRGGEGGGETRRSGENFSRSGGSTLQNFLPRETRGEGGTRRSRKKKKKKKKKKKSSADRSIGRDRSTAIDPRMIDRARSMQSIDGA